MARAGHKTARLSGAKETQHTTCHKHKAHEAGSGHSLVPSFAYSAILAWQAHGQSFDSIRSNELWLAGERIILGGVDEIVVGGAADALVEAGVDITNKDIARRTLHHSVVVSLYRPGGVVPADHPGAIGTQAADGTILASVLVGIDDVLGAGQAGLASLIQLAEDACAVSIRGIDQLISRGTRQELHQACVFLSPPDGTLHHRCKRRTVAHRP